MRITYGLGLTGSAIAALVLPAQAQAGTWRLRASDGANGAPKMPEVRMARL